MTKRKKTTPIVHSKENCEVQEQQALGQANEAQVNPQNNGPAKFPIVGIGASAGGLAAFEAFFSNMPADIDPSGIHIDGLGMAFVLVQHLAPDHKSILTDLIRRYTRMKVYEVEDGMIVQPNCTYIIPPNRDMAFINGTLQLIEQTAPRGHRLPIDFFFRSLAQDQREQAICIILSGTGSDGTLGARAIKSEGGMVMAQNPESTEYDGMPINIINTGLVDYVLPPAEMPAQLIAYMAHSFGKLPKIALNEMPKTENAIKKLFVLLRSQTGHDFSHYKPSTIMRRIERRMAIQQIISIEPYLKFELQTPKEVESLFHDLLIGVTNFFRDPEAFAAVEENIIPLLFNNKNSENAVRVWVPGCSTGEEAYSLAILIAERLDVLKRDFFIQVFATDIDSNAIATARAGVYPASIANDITPERLARFFIPEPGGGAYRVHKRIRDMLIFSEQNLTRDPPFSKLDFISCRNLMIYMDSNLQKKIIPLFHYALNPRGFLFLGTSETIGEYVYLFSTFNRKFKLYQCKENIGKHERTVISGILPAVTTVVKPLAIGKTALPSKYSVREITEQAILQKFTPAAALINSHGDILYLHGRTGMFLEPAPGEMGTANIIKMAREGLRRDLTSALHRAVTTQEQIQCCGLRVKTNGDYSLVNLTVSKITSSGISPVEQSLYLVILEIVSSDGVEPQPVTNANTENALITTLQQELRANQEYLQSTHEELETANEELKSSNEEMQSVNEELQSTNEELETSKEELQSVNEELSTVNTELQTKVADLSRSNNDMNNLLAGTGIGTIFVDHSLCIMRFTPTATKIINLIQSDIGRPVNHILSNIIGYETLIPDLQVVLETLVHKELEVQTRAGIWYAMRIQPYRTLDNIIEGAVLTFVDINKTKKLNESLRETLDIRETAMNQSMSGIAIAEAPSGKISYINNSELLTKGNSREEIINSVVSLDQYVSVWRLFDLDGTPLAKDAVPLARAILYGEQNSREFIIRHSDETDRIVSAKAEPVKNDQGQVTSAIMVFIDITEQKKLEKALQQAREKL